MGSAMALANKSTGTGNNQNTVPPQMTIEQQLPEWIRQHQQHQQQEEPKKYPKERLGFTGDVLRIGSDTEKAPPFISIHRIIWRYGRSVRLRHACHIIPMLPTAPCPYWHSDYTS
jgi:hypothetical protein